MAKSRLRLNAFKIRVWNAAGVLLDGVPRLAPGLLPLSCHLHLRTSEWCCCCCCCGCASGTFCHLQSLTAADVAKTSLGDHLIACPRSGVLRRRGAPLERAAARVCRRAGATVATCRCKEGSRLLSTLPSSRF